MRGGRGGLYRICDFAVVCGASIPGIIPWVQSGFASFTLFVIGFSELFQAWWCEILSATIFAAVAFMQAKRRSPAFSRALDILSLKMPIIGNILHKSSNARFARTLATMLTAGVPLVEAVDSVAGARQCAISRGNLAHERRGSDWYTTAAEHAHDRAVSPHGGANGCHRRGIRLAG
jgi:type II secretory pathway component PulF